MDKLQKSFGDWKIHSKNSHELMVAYFTNRYFDLLRANFNNTIAPESIFSISKDHVVGISTASENRAKTIAWNTFIEVVQSEFGKNETVSVTTNQEKTEIQFTNNMV